ncbi:MAG: hypothetical protein QM831_29760 [Kofleriaceae bacterium]
MQNKLLVLALVVGCNDPQSVEPVVMTTIQPEPKPEHVASGVPHGALITSLAITEEGDAAVSGDMMSGLRLWPSLDGKHEAVPFVAPGIEQVAITHLGDELLIGLVDQAGTATLARFSKAGAERGRVSLPADTAIEQLIAIDGTVLVRRVDQVIERYDARGKLLGRLGAAPGISLESLTARKGIAAVLEVERRLKPVPGDVKRAAHKPEPPPVITPTAEHMRFIKLDKTALAWGDEIVLPSETSPTALALSPNHERFAVASMTGSALKPQIYAVKEPLKPLDMAQTEYVQPDAMFGFADNDHVGIQTSGQMTWVSVRVPEPATAKETKYDPWQVTGTGYKFATPHEATNDHAAGFGDNMFVAAIGVDLVMMTPETTRYLGWESLATGNLTIAGPHVGIESGVSHTTWLDHDLVRETEVDTADLGFGRPTRLYWLDQNHAVFEDDKAATYDKDNNYQQHSQMSLVDFRHRDQKRELGDFGYIQRVELQEDVHQLVIVETGGIHRWDIDIDHDRVTPLPVLKATKVSGPQFVRMLDPKKADGVVAIVAGYTEDGMRVERFKADSVKGVGEKEPVGGLLAIGPHGELYERAATNIIVQHGSERVTWPAPTVAEAVVIDPHGGDRAATLHGTEIAVNDLRGGRKWMQSIWGAQNVVFTGDGQRVIVRTMGGLVLLDAETGKKLGTACGFAFGVMKKTPVSIAMNAAPVCEDPGT